jgi:hypothetical protein
MPPIRLEQVDDSDKNHDRHYRKAAAIKVPGEKSVHTIVGLYTYQPRWHFVKVLRSRVTGDPLVRFPRNTST